MSFLIRLLVWLWPLWLWFGVRHLAALQFVGTVYWGAAQTAAPLALLVVAAMLHRMGLAAQVMLWGACFGSLASGLIGLYWEYLRWEPVLWSTSAATIAAHLDWPLALASLACLMAPWFVRRDLLVRVRNSAPAGLHGSAEWLPMVQARERLGEGSLVLGEAYSPSETPLLAGKALLLRFDGRGHLLTIAGSGSGKTVSVAIPNALTWRGGLVVHDPKGEIYRDTAAHRRALGRTVLRLDPQVDDSDAIDVLSWIARNRSSLAEDARAVVSWMMPTPTEIGPNDYFRKSAASLLELLILFVLTAPELADDQRDLVTVRYFALSPQLEAALRRMIELGPQHAFGALYRRARSFEEMTKAESQWAGIVGELDNATDWLEVESLANLVRADRARFDLDVIAADASVDVYIALPLKTLESTPQCARVLLGALLNAVYERRRANDNSGARTLFLIDEMPRLKKMELLEVARDAGRGLGVTLWCIAQDLGQLRAAYGEHGLTGWLESAHVKQFFGISDIETAERVSKILGTTTVSYESTSVSRQGGLFGLPETSSSVSQHLSARPLLMPDELMHLPVDNAGTPDEQILLVRGMKPIRCGLAKHYRRNDLRTIA